MEKVVDYSSYKNLVVFQKAKDLSVDLFKYLVNLKYPKLYEFVVNQLLRSTTSISANIAEGYGRYYQKSYRQFLAIARGSAFETEYWLSLALELKIFDNDRINVFLNKNLEIIKMLTVLIRRLAKSQKKERLS